MKRLFALFLLASPVAAQDINTARRAVASEIKLAPVAKSDTYRFEEKKGEYIDLYLGDRKVLRYMNMPRDGSSKDKHEMSFKPFHHVYDPVKGETLLTNGAGLAADKSNLFPHHRGIFFAFNKVSYGKETCDVWHGRANEYVEHDKVLEAVADDKHAVQKNALSWHGKDGKVFANEVRTLTVTKADGGTLIDFDSVLKTDLEKVRLDGDPQHAGFHFRAAMEVSKHGKMDTYYVRPDGVGKPGETRNWDAKGKDAKTVNVPWDACSFVIQGQRYTVLRMVNPNNPKDWRGSERDYGRFGDYFEWDLTPKTPLHVQYRLWIQPGEMKVEDCEKAYKDYVNK
ncbi:hypothetical protein BH11PLA2_BH11PLA2_22870 [soil metagenome]